MNSASKYAVLALLVVSITGCAPEKKTNPVPPPQAQAPSIESGKPGAMYPPPLAPTTPTQETPPPAPQPTVASVQPPPPEPEPEKSRRTTSARKSKPSAAKPAPAAQQAGENIAAANSSAPAPAGPPAEPPVQQASSGQPAPLLRLVSSLLVNPAAGRQTRRETLDLITNTENGLKGIKRNLSAAEQQTATQIQTFLTKARQALSTDDVDGAHTLATKAKVLLDELTKRRG